MLSYSHLMLEPSHQTRSGSKWQLSLTIIQGSKNNRYITCVLVHPTYVLMRDSAIAKNQLLETPIVAQYLARAHKEGLQRKLPREPWWIHERSSTEGHADPQCLGLLHSWMFPQSSVSTSQVNWLWVTNLPSSGIVDLLWEKVVRVFQPPANAATETKALLTTSGP